MESESRDDMGSDCFALWEVRIVEAVGMDSVVVEGMYWAITDSPLIMPLVAFHHNRETMRVLSINLLQTYQNRDEFPRAADTADGIVHDQTKPRKARGRWSPVFVVEFMRSTILSIQVRIFGVDEPLWIPKSQLDRKRAYCNGDRNFVLQVNPWWIIYLRKTQGVTIPEHGFPNESPEDRSNHESRDG